MKNALNILLLLLLTGCISLFPRVSENMDGKTLTVNGLSYEQIWKDTYSVIDNRYFLLDNSEQKNTGVILAGSNHCAFGSDDFVGIYITPTTANAKDYSIKIVTNTYGDQSNKELQSELSKMIEAKMLKDSTNTAKITY